jgi:hypothetical protein
MEKQDSREKELLEQIKFCLECKNENQAIRLIEKYGYEQKEIHIISSYEKGLKYTNDEVVMILQRRLMSVGVISSLRATEIWFNQYKK